MKQVERDALKGWDVGEAEATEAGAPLTNNSVPCRWVKLECPDNYENGDINTKSVTWGNKTRQVHRLLNGVSSEIFPAFDLNQIVVRSEKGGGVVRIFYTYWF